MKTEEKYNDPMKEIIDVDLFTDSIETILEKIKLKTNFGHKQAIQIEIQKNYDNDSLPYHLIISHPYLYDATLLNYDPETGIEFKDIFKPENFIDNEIPKFLKNY